MSGFRPFYKKLWNDPDFLELPPDDKLLFIYFFTNHETNESGIYPLSPKTVSRETGIPLPMVEQRFANGLVTVQQLLGNSLSTVSQLFTNGCIKNIFYDTENKLIFVKNLKKYNTGGRKDLVFKAVSNEYKQYKHSSLWDFFFEYYPEYNDINQLLDNGSETVPQRLDNPTILLKDNDIDKDTTKEKGEGENPNDIRREVMAKTKEIRGYDVRNRGAEISAINDMIKEGFNAKQIVEAYKKLREQPFFQDKYLSLNYVYKNIHELLKNSSKKESDKYKHMVKQ
jgi:hypothetical protein